MAAQYTFRADTAGLYANNLRQPTISQPFEVEPNGVDHSQPLLAPQLHKKNDRFCVETLATFFPISRLLLVGALRFHGDDARW